MTDIKPGDKFKIRHETHGSGEGVWSGPYECEILFGNVVYCVKVEENGR